MSSPASYAAVAVILRKAVTYAFEHGALQAVDMAVIDSSGGPQDQTRLGRTLPADGTQNAWVPLYVRTHEVLGDIATGSWHRFGHDQAKALFIRAAEWCEAQPG